MRRTVMSGLIGALTGVLLLPAHPRMQEAGAKLGGQVPAQAQAPAPAAPVPAPAAQGNKPAPVPSISQRPNGASLGTIRVGAADETFWFGWRVGMPADALTGLTLSEALANADVMSVTAVEASSTQIVSPEVPKPLDARLQPGERSAIVHRLRELNQRILAYRIDDLGVDAAARRRVFELAKAIEAPLIVTRADTPRLAEIDALAGELGINVALESTGDPSALVRALDGHSRRLGIAVDLAAWMRAGIVPADTLATVKERLLSVRMTVPGGADSRRALEAFFLAAFRAGVKPLAITVAPAGTAGTAGVAGGAGSAGGSSGATGATGVSRGRATNGARGASEADVLSSLTTFERVMWPAMAERVRQVLASPAGEIRGPDRLAADMRQQIDAATPREPLVKPAKPRKLLVTDVQMYSGHATIPHGNLLLELMGRYTGAFEPTFSNDPSLLTWPKIKQFDAVFLNNVCGMVHNDPEVRAGLLRFVREGGGIGGNHAVTYANNNWPEFAEMMGGWAGAHHVETQVVKIDDPDSPLMRSFGGGSFEHTDEFYIFPPSSPYSRAKQRVLLSIDVAKSDRATANRFCAACTRPDQDYGLAWIKAYGKGRTYFTPLGHTTIMYTDRRWTGHLLAAVQYILGDLDADATPNPKPGASAGSKPRTTPGTRQGTKPRTR